MTGAERRNKLYEYLCSSEGPVLARSLAEMFGVSRQIIVSDIALLRAQDHEIIATSRGYILVDEHKEKRVFKVNHSDEDCVKELNIIVDYGGTVEDVFVYHRSYGTVRAELNISSRKDVQDFLETIRTGKSGFLKNITSNYHYHTVSASSEEILDLIYEQLEKEGFLAQLQDYEPVDFWKNDSTEE